MDVSKQLQEGHSMFFSDKVGIAFKPFGILHFSLFILIIAGVLLLYIFREQIRSFRYERRLAKGMALFALFWEFSLYAWHVGNGHYDWAEILPIGLCGFTLYLGMTALFFRKKAVFEIGYFWTWGAIASVLFPDISYSLDRFRFYQFMIGHMFFFIMYMYMIFVYRWVPTWTSWRRSVLALSAVTLILIILSNLTHRNLMFMLNSEGTPLSMFEGHGYALYLLGVIGLSVAVMAVWYIPFGFVNQRMNIQSPE